MTTWSDLSLLHLTKTTIKLQRHKHIEQEYNNLIKNNKVDITYIKDYLLYNNWCLIDNKYPYIIPNNTIHMVFWFKTNYTMEEALNIIYTIYSNNNYDIIIFENDISVKSVKEIKHYHVFIKHKKF